MGRPGARADAFHEMTATTTQQTAAARRTEALWREYHRTGDIQLRNRLVVALMPLVRHVVYRKVRELPARYEVEDFVSCGLEALVTALDRFDPAKGASLEQFAWIRVRGAVLDELRRQDWAPRSLRRWERDISRARDRFTAVEGRRPSAAELAGVLETSVDELRGKQDEIAVAEVGSLNVTVSDEDHGSERIETLRSTDDRHDPEQAAALGEAKDRFRSAFDTLPERDREVAVLLYVKNMTLREIGDHLGVSESRVCQIHSHLKSQLKRQLSGDAELFRTAV